MESFLTKDQRDHLSSLQRKVSDKSQYVRVTVLLLLDKGRNATAIAEDLGINTFRTLAKII